MAKQDGILPIKGSIDNLTFTKRKSGGYGAQKKNGFSADRIANDPAFIRTRENGAEFGRAGRAGKLLRASLSTILGQLSDKTALTRLMKVMMRVIKSDSVNDRGLRTVTDGELEFLEEFEFNESSPIKTSFKGIFTPLIDRVTGMLKITMPGFIPNQLVSFPKGATHFRFIVAGFGLDFTAGTFEGVINPADYFPIDATNTGEVVIEAAIRAGMTSSLFLFFGIEYFQFVNTKMYPFADKSFNSLSIVKTQK